MHFRPLFAALVLALAGCGAPERIEYRLSGPAMGTVFNVTVVAGRDFDGDFWRQAVYAELDAVDATMSTYREDSELARFNRLQSGDWIDVSASLCEAVERSLALGVQTGGAFDITVGPLVDLWGFGPGEPRDTPPDDAAVAAALAVTGSELLHADCTRGALQKDVPGLRIDLSAFAKGLAADRVAARLDAAGQSDYLVEIGGDLRVRGRNAGGQPWRIAIERPDGGGRAIEKIVPMAEGALATSGDYRNYFESGGRRYSHTIDPRTGRPVTHALASASVLFDNAAAADGLATALMVLGPDAALAFAEREEIAVLLLVREESGFSERMTGAFAARLPQ